MNDHPKVKVLKRGGKYRRCFMVQPYLRPYIWRGKVMYSMDDIYRCVAMELV